jgi:flavodoxin
MLYEIAYISRSGNTEKLANGIADKLPPNASVVTNLTEENITGKADTYLLCFGVNKGTVPIALMDALDELSEKRIMFFVTGGAEPTEEYKAAIEKKIVPFIPDDCEYCGLFMCRGKFDDKIVSAAKETLQNDPENIKAQKILECAKKAESHPDADDFDNAVKFIEENL